MNTKQKLHQLRLNEWSSRFSDQKASGLTVKQWCDQNNLSIHTYNYWKHLLKEELASPVLPDIVPVSLPDTTNELPPMVSNYSSLTNRAIRSTEKLTINNISIEVDSAISAAFLTTLIKAVLDA